MANRKGIAFGVASVLVVACVVAAAVTLTKHDEESRSDSANVLATSTKSVESMCQPTPYKATCEKSLSSAKNVSEPKDYIKVAFESTVEDIRKAIENTTLFKKAASDDMTKDALQACEELFDLAIEDLRKSVEKLDTFSITKIQDMIDDLKTWLSAVITYEETCIDGFKSTEGETGEKMVKVLNTTREMSVNALVMVSSFGDMVSQSTGQSRKLLSNDFVAATERRLLQISAAQPNAVVALDGSGQFKSINEAVKTVPKKNAQPFVILIKAGTYQEYVDVPKHATNVVFIGEGPTKTIITGNKAVDKGAGIATTFHTNTVGVSAEGFIIKDIGIENTAGNEKEQAVALRISGDRSAIYNCKIDGHQDTLYAHTNRQFYRDCSISGTIDFLFGNGEAVFQNCKLFARKPADKQDIMVTAQGRLDATSMGAIVLQNCEIRPEEGFQLGPGKKAFLGRPWKEFSRTVIMQSFIDGFIDPTGWAPWNTTEFGLHTCYYAEYQNRGPGANTDNRVSTWKGYQKSITPEVAATFTPGVYLSRGGAPWLPVADIPYEPGMMNV